MRKFRARSAGPLTATATTTRPNTAATTPGTPRAESRFYVRMAYACAAIAVLGFVPSYWVPAATGTFPGTPVLHLHGLLFTAWTILFVVQTRLAASSRFERHRLLGYAGISIATAMLLLGVLVVLQGIDSAALRGLESRARAFSIVPITIILFFFATVTVALANVRRPDVHKRLMVVASITLLTPAFARIIALVAPEGAPQPGLGGEPPPVVFSLVPSFLSNLLLVWAMLHDWRTLGHPHRVYWIAGAALVAVELLRVPLGQTTAWHTVTVWLSGMGG